MNKLKVTALAVAMLASAGVAMAQNVLTVHLGNNEAVEFALSDEPNVTATGDSVVIKSRSVEVAYAMADIAYLDYSNSTTGLNTTKSGESDIQRIGNTLIMHGQNAGEAVNVYTIDGKLVNSVKVDAQGKAVVSLETLAAGVYVVKANGKSTKIAKF
jgi:hypothetical protein